MAVGSGERWQRYVAEVDVRCREAHFGVLGVLWLPDGAEVAGAVREEEGIEAAGVYVSWCRELVADWSEVEVECAVENEVSMILKASDGLGKVWGVAGGKMIPILASTMMRVMFLPLGSVVS